MASEPGEEALALRHDIRELDSWEQLLTALVAFLLSAGAGFVTGATVDVDDGLLMR